MKLARNRHEIPERMRCAQDGDMAGNARLETLADQTRPRFGRGKLIGIFQIVEKGQVHRTGFVERSQRLDLLAAA
jgi:hypothetical protein